MNSKSQMAVFVIAIAVISMFVMFVVLVDPFTRYEILYGPLPGENDTNGDTPPAGENEFYSANLNQYIGGTSGEQIGSTHILQNIYVEHPLVLSTIETASSAEIPTNIWSAFVRSQHPIEIPEFINANNSESIELGFTLSSTIGNPRVRVWLNDVILSERSMDIGEESQLSIQTSQLGETNNIYIECVFTGWLWEGQVCSISDISLERGFYLGTYSDNIETVNIDEDEKTAGVMAFTFWVEGREPGGMLEIYMNDGKIYEGYPAVGNESFEVKSPTLLDTNTFTFTATEGGTYRVTKVEIDFRTEIEPRQIAVINLPDSIAQEIRASGKDVRFVLTVTDVVIDGWVYFKVYPAHILHTEGVMEGSVFADVPNSEIDESANTIRIEGPNSKFYVSQFRIIEKE